MGCTIALAGNPNCGKTTVFNEITGSKQHVGNWPGVTVEKKEGKYRKNKDVNVVDLPGIYSLSPYSAEEIVARNYIINEKPDVLINIIDATNIERNMYLTLQILETKIPTVIALNMMDEVEARGTKINIAKLSKYIGVKIVPIVARTGKGIKELMNAAIEVANSVDINQKSKEGGTNNKMTKFEELLAKYGKTAEDVTFDYTEMSDEELEAKFAEMFDDDNSEGDNSGSGESGEPSNDGEGDGEGVSDPDGNEGESQTFEKIVRTYEISHEDTRYALYQLLSEYEDADNEWYFINAVYDDHFTYENWNGDKIFGQNYTKDGDNVAFDGERYNLHRELLTDSEFAELQSMRSNYAALKEFKETAEKNELHAKREKILANENFASISEKDEEGNFINKDFEKLYTNMDNYSLEDLEKEAKLIYADSNMKTFAATTDKTQKKSTVKVFANVNKFKKDNRYGNLFSK